MLDSVSISPHWTSPTTCPRPPRLPVRHSQTSGYIRITMDLTDVIQKCIFLDLEWGPGTGIFNKHPVRVMQISKDHRSPPKWGLYATPAWPWELEASRHTFRTSLGVYHPQCQWTMTSPPVISPPYTSVLLPLFLSHQPSCCVT